MRGVEGRVCVIVIKGGIYKSKEYLLEEGFTH